MYRPSLHHALLILAASMPLFIVAIFKQTQVPGMMSSMSAGEICAEGLEGIGCWQGLDSRPDCYLWDDHLEVNSTVTWSGACNGGLAEGDGDIKWVWGSDRENIGTYTGHLRQGRMDGQWSTLDADGTQGEGAFVDGKRHGGWIFRSTSGAVIEGSYVDGKEIGQWVVRQADGTVHEGPVVDGKRHGRWSEGLPLGFVQEGPFVNGKRHGQWIVHWFNVRVITMIWDDGILMWEWD